MMTHPASASSTARAVAKSAAGVVNELVQAAGADLEGANAPASSEAASMPFARALQALANGHDAPASPAPGAGTAVPHAKPTDKEAVVAAPTVATPGEKSTSAPPAATALAEAGAWTSSPSTADTTGVGATKESAPALPAKGGTRAASTRPSTTRVAAQSAKNASPRPKTVAPAMPKDLLQALFAAKSALPAQGGALQDKPVVADDDHHDATGHDSLSSDAKDTSAATPTTAAVPVVVPAQPQPAETVAPLLAAVLQWMHAPLSGTDDQGPAPSSLDTDRTTTAAVTSGVTAAASAPAAPGAWATIAAAATAAATSSSNAGASANAGASVSGTAMIAASGAPAATAHADASNTLAPGTASPATPASSAHASSVRDDLAASLKDVTVAVTAFAAPGKPLAPRDADAAAAPGDAPPLPRAVADAAVGSLSMAAALRVANTGAASPAERTVAVAVHDRHWPTAVATQVLILSNDKVQAATLRLSPEHLGPVEVRIDLQDANVNVSFTAAHADTRSALEQALPELRNVLAGAGLTLGQATVQQQARRESQNPQPVPRGGNGVETPIEAPAAAMRTLGMIDEYV